MTSDSVPAAQVPEIAREYSDHGFVIISDAPEASLVADVFNEIEEIVSAEASRFDIRADSIDDRVIELFSKGHPYRSGLYDVFQRLVSINRLAMSGHLQKIAKGVGVVRPNVRNVALRIDLPGEDQFLQPLHQDVRGMRAERCVNLWIPLRDVDESSGALALYKMSHTLGPIVADKRSSAGYQMIDQDVVASFEKTVAEISAGNLVAFHPYLVHGSTPNRSNSVRWTITVRFDDATDMRWMEEGVNPFEELDRQKEVS